MSSGLLLLILALGAAACAVLASGLLLRALMADMPVDDTLGSAPAPGPWVPSLAVWRRVRGWFGGGPPMLTYRRDSRGRFRSVRH